MTTSDKGINLIKGFESLQLRPYLDSASIPTIGYGHTKGVKITDAPITEAVAIEYLKADLGDAESAVNRLVKVPLNSNEFDALVSFTFNLGGGALQGSTLLRYLNSGKYNEAAGEFKRWDKARVNGKMVSLSGLKRRRLAEETLFRQPI